MEVAASVATELALSGLSRVLNKLASNFGGDVTADKMEHLKVFVGYEIEALIREATSDDLLTSAPLLEKLQAAALELEDLLDLYEYDQIEKQVSSSSSSSNPIKKLKPILKERLRPILPKSHLRTGLEKLLKFVEQVERKHPFIMSRKVTTQPLAKTVTPKTSTLSSPFYGREDQCETIIKLLLDESHADLNSRTKNVPIIAIRGLGGAGKTTTAQHLYNENKIVNYFDLRMWVHVTRGFDERRLIKEIIESAGKNACPQISNPDMLQTNLKDSVSKKKFLLVLDDVWEEDTSLSRLDLVLSPLNKVGVKGSRIIVTTRTEKAAQDLRAKPIVLLDELKDEDCWSILKDHVFDDNDETIEGLEELKYVGNQIISKVKHSPLALKVVGSSLRNKRSANEWEKILQQKDILKDTMDLLLFSYQCLPLHLQRCFAYCSLFPKGYKFDFDVQGRRPHLIFLWIAQGFIENTSELTLEEEGQKYIEELLSYSFFEKKSNYFFGDHFIIHDLLHDLAENVSKKQCHRIECRDLLHIPTTCIHLSLSMSSFLPISNILKLKNLRTLIIFWFHGSKNILKNKIDIFQNLTKLRALYVDPDLQIEVLSDPHIDQLKHLRYLHLRYDNKLPVSLAKLYQLQFFILTTDLVGNGKHLPADTLPQGFSNLSNFRTLQFYNPHGVVLDYLYYNSKTINIERLTSLQNLKKFYVNVNGMISLRNLPLRGSLSIRNLENVRCKKEAEKAMLNKKKNLNELIFKWSDTSSSIDTCEEVLEGIEPYRNLENLAIKGYQGVKFPKWMVKENWLPRLQTLSLYSCKSLKIVPILPPRLLKLYVFNCNELMQLPPPSDTLRALRLIDCPKLMPPSLSLLTNLEILCLTGFPNLQTLPNLSPTVTDLIIGNCSKFTSLGNLQRYTSLKELEIMECPMLKRLEASLVEGVVEGDIVNRLQQVEFISTDEPLLVLELVQQQAFSSIKQLHLHESALPNLQMLSSLQTLGILNCPDVKSCPKLWLKDKYEEGGPLHHDLKEKLSSLRSLKIYDCPAIESLPNLPLSLEIIDICGCPKLKEKYEEGGPLRNTISHIPYICFDWM